MTVAESNVHASQHAMIDSGNAKWFAGPMGYTPGHEVHLKRGWRLTDNRQLVSLVRHKRI